MFIKLPNFDKTTPEKRENALNDVLEKYSLKDFNTITGIINNNLVEEGYVKNNSNNQAAIKHDILYNKKSYEAIALALESGLHDREHFTNVAKNAIYAVENSQTIIHTAQAEHKDTVLSRKNNEIEDAKTFPLADQKPIIKSPISNPKTVAYSSPAISPEAVASGHLHSEQEKKAAEKVLANLEGENSTSLKQLNNVLKSMGVEQVSDETLKNGLSYKEYEKTVATLKGAISEWQEANSGDKIPFNTVHGKNPDGRIHDVLYTKR